MSEEAYGTGLPGSSPLDIILASCDALSARMDAVENAKADAAWAKADEKKDFSES